MLVCSPMGCIRDRIKYDHFIANLLHLKKDTEATILIVTFIDTSRSNLCSGLIHTSFVKYLHQITINEIIITINNLIKELSSQKVHINQWPVDWWIERETLRLNQRLLNFVCKEWDLRFSNVDNYTDLLASATLYSNFNELKCGEKSSAVSK